jgi:hypothetical protein
MEVIATVSGRPIKIDAIRLHSMAGIRKWQRLLALGQELMQGFSTGIGFWGSPGYVLAGAAVLGVFEASVSNANHRKGLAFLVEAASLLERLRARGAFVPVERIEGIRSHAPNNWFSVGEIASEVELNKIEPRERAAIIRDYGITKQEELAGFAVRDTTQQLVFLPDEFVTVESEGRSINVRWSSVETYEVS